MELEPPQAQEASTSEPPTPNDMNVSCHRKNIYGIVADERFSMVGRSIISSRGSIKILNL